MNYPGYNKKIIGDYNAEGFDSVESEEFEPGFGCVPVEQPYVQQLPPDLPKQTLTEDEKKRRDFFYMTEDEKQRIEDEYLAKHGII